jgi:hypothetical protein
MNNPDHFFKLRNNFFLFFGIKIFKFFAADPGSGIRDQFKSEIWDLGSGIRNGKKLDPKSGITILTFLGPNDICLFFRVQPSQCLLQ